MREMHCIRRKIAKYIYYYSYAVSNFEKGNTLKEGRGMVLTEKALEYYAWKERWGGEGEKLIVT